MSVFHGLFGGNIWHPPTIGADPGADVGVGVRVCVGVGVGVLIETTVSLRGTLCSGVPVTAAIPDAVPSPVAPAPPSGHRYRREELHRPVSTR